MVGKVAAVLVGIVVILVLLSSASLFEKVDADEIMVVQSPVSGTLTWYNTAGVKWQGFGKVTLYKKRSQFWFSKSKDQGAEVDQSIKVRFNDAGHANLSGSISWEMPTDVKNLNSLHTKYGSQEAVEKQLIRPIVEKAVYMTGPLMSSKESYAERRNELLSYIEDQVQNGIYATHTISEDSVDPITGQPKKIAVVELVQKNGQTVRQDESPLKEFGIRVYNPSINEIVYDETVEKQIQEQQKLTMQVQTAIAEAKQAEQRAVTVEKQGEADAAKAKWEQEVIKARAVTEAEQKLAVAKLEADAAEQYKRGQLLRAEGDSEYKKKMMEADGALTQKLQAWIQVNQAWAAAIQNHQGPLTPTIVSGPGGQTGSTSMDLIELLRAKTASDLALDMTVAKQ